MRKTNPYQNKTVWVIGASDGIGKATTQALARQGANLVISSRSQDKLDDLKSQLLSNITVKSFDVSDPVSTKESMQWVVTTHSPDYIIYLPAYYEPAKIGRIATELIEKTISVNLTSVFIFIENIIGYLHQKPSCTLAIVASAAGYVGLPHSQPYGATKAGVISLVESFKAEYPSFDIKLINPGFIKTKLTDKNQFKMPALMSTEAAALKIIKGLNTSKFEIHFPKRFTWILKFISILPYRVYFNLFIKRRN